jgi:predicted 3-demethylubiquinone-9 3-methyltransferase (glyoxalase superfamily)
MANMQKIKPNLWFANEAEQAVNFYTSIFKDSAILKTTRYGKEGFEIHQMPEGTVMTIEFQLEGENFVALNGGPVFQFNEAVSFIVECDNQEEVDYYWDSLSEGGDKKAQVCGWLKDKFGLSWQVVPRILEEMMADTDREKAGRVMNAMLQMKKIDISELQRAYDGREVATY